MQEDVPGAAAHAAHAESAVVRSQPGKKKIDLSFGVFIVGLLWGKDIFDILFSFLSFPKKRNMLYLNLRV